MIFNSLAFLLFLPTVLVAYWSLQGKTRAQNLLLLVASYVFYGWWDYRFLGLIVLSSTVDYVVGYRLSVEKITRRRKAWLVVSLAVNLGLLGFFKYFNFFAESFSELLSLAGLHASPFTLRVVLPVGISFYTFQTLSYTIDIYRGKLEPTRDVLAFFAFVAFFPQLVAGPIERAKNLLPQFLGPRKLDWTSMVDGFRQILWGFFKKVVVADNLSPVVDHIFSNSSSMDSMSLAFGAFFFATQIYCDFSGYSDIAIGTARFFGFRLMVNFSFPYFSRDIGEFWRRWHISLSTWFRDYVFIPMGGSRCSSGRYMANIVTTFTISGLWHGANWTFVFWGFLNGLFYLPLVLRAGALRYKGDSEPLGLLPSPSDLIRIIGTFVATLFAWVFFRADSLGHAFSYITRILVAPTGAETHLPVKALAVSFCVFFIEWFRKSSRHTLDIGHYPKLVRWAVYYALLYSILFFGNFNYTPFIYFQF